MISSLSQASQLRMDRSVIRVHVMCAALPALRMPAIESHSQQRVSNLRCSGSRTRSVGSRAIADTGQSLVDCDGS